MCRQKITSTAIFGAIIALAAPMVAWGAPTIQSDQACEVQYFDPEDHLRENPKTKPHSDFLKDYRRALKGDAISQRNVAVSYESGYLAGKCPEKAAFWYGKATKGGDEISQKWTDRHKMFQELAAGPECAGNHCNINWDGAPQIMSLVIDPKGHYYTDLTINGVTVRGMIDTGAFAIALNAATAQSMGISFKDSKAGVASTAGGSAIMLTKVVPFVRIGTIGLENVQIAILPNSGVPLIGMSVLSRLKISAAGGQMTLSK